MLPAISTEIVTGLIRVKARVYLLIMLMQWQHYVYRIKDSNRLRCKVGKRCKVDDVNINSAE